MCGGGGYMPGGYMAGGGIEPGGGGGPAQYPATDGDPFGAWRVLLKEENRVKRISKNLIATNNPPVSSQLINPKSLKQTNTSPNTPKHINTPPIPQKHNTHNI